MNKVFRVIWSEAQGAWVAVSETTKSHSKRSRKAVLALALASGSLLGVSGYAAATGLGNVKTPVGEGSIAIGPAVGDCSAPTAADGEYSVSIGCEAGAFAQGEKQTNLGYQAGINSKGERNTAIGANAGENVIGTTNLAVGSSAGGSVHGDTNLAVGSNSGTSVKGDNNVSVGVDTGKGTVGSHNAALGTEAGAATQGSNNTAFGRSAGKGVEGSSNTSLGNGAGMFQIGNGNLSAGLAAGQSTYGDHNVILGNSATVTGSSEANPIHRTVVLGAEASAAHSDTVAIGTKAKAEHANSVALGNLSVTKALVQAPDAVFSYTDGNGATRTLTYGNFAGTATGVVSVGVQGAERQIVNVAPGTIDKDSTDAINGSQLFSVNRGLNTQINVLGDSISNSFGGNTTYNGGKINLDLTVNNKTHNTVQDAFDAAKTEVKAGTNIVSVDKDPTSDHSIYTVNAKGTTVSAGSALKVTSTANATTNITDYEVDLSTKTKDTIDNALQEVVTQIDGTTVKTINKADNTANFVTGNNIALSNDTKGGIKIATKDDVTFDSVTTAGGVMNKDGFFTGTYINSQGDTVNGPSMSITGIDAGGQKITGVAAGIADTDAVNVSQLNAFTGKGWELGSKDAAGADQTLAVKSGGKVNLDAGKNMQVTSTQDAVSGEITTTFTTTPDVAHNSVTTGDKSGDHSVLDASGLTVGDTTVTKDGVQVGADVSLDKQGLTAGGTSVTDAGLTFAGSDVAVNKDGINAGNQKVTNVKAGIAPTDGVNVSQLGNIAGVIGGVTVDANGKYTGPNFKVNNTNNTTIAGAIEELDKGWNFTAEGKTYQVQAGDEVKFAAGDNIEITHDGSGNATVKTAQNVTFNSVTTAGGVMNENGFFTGTYINSQGDTVNGPSMSITGIDAGGKKITNVAAGTDPTDGVNVSQLQGVQDTANAGWDIATSDSSTNTSNVAPKAQVDFVSSDKNVAIKNTRDADGNTSIDFALNNELNLGVDGKDGVDGKIAVNGKDGTSGVVINGADGSIGLTGPKGANGEPGAHGTISVINGVAGVDGKDGITRIVIEGNEVATMKDGLKFAGNTGDTIAKELNDTLTVSGELENDKDASGANLRVDSNNGQLNLVMAKDLVDINSITINNGGPVISQAGINMGNKQITNLLAGTQDDHAVNLGQLNDVKGTAEKGWDISTNGGTAQNVAPGAGVDFSAGDNIQISQNGTDIEIATTPDVAHNSVTTGDKSGDHSVLDASGLTVGDTTVTKDGVQVGADVSLDKQGLTAGGTSVTDAGLTFAGSDVAVNKDGINAGGKKIVGVADGEISASSKEAVNGSQLHGMQVEIDKQAEGWTLTDGKTKQQVKAGDQVAIVGGNNIKVEFDKAGDMVVETNPDVNHNSVTTGDTVINSNGLTITGGPSITKSGIDAGDKKVTGVAKGDISATSTDAVNGSQLNDTNNRVTVNEGNIKNIQDGKDGMFQVSQDYNAPAPKPTGTKSAAGGAGAVASGNNSTAIGNDAQATANNSTAIGNSALASSSNSVALGQGSVADRDNSVSVGSAGGERQITNVAAGVAPTDAVNVSQLDQLGGAINQYFNATNKRIDKVDNNARAGIAAAMAAGTLPQSTLPGKSMVTAGASTYRGESAIAIGVSRLSDNARTVIKANASADSRGNAGAAVGAGWHW